MRMLVVPQLWLCGMVCGRGTAQALGILAQGMSGACSRCRDSAGTGTPRHTPSVGLQLH